ncbi:hypothetical protein [Streptosporangium sp. KLBMP 9127]|nr:hypothetical protein [Streptosporangium sp. KLBMP 9127]
MSRVRHVAIVGAIAVFGAVGCTAEAGTGGSAPTPAATPTASPMAGREDITVRLNPDRVIEGETSTVWILANCPVPTGGPEHSGTGNSDAFVRAVTLEPVPPPTSKASPTSTAAPEAVPWVRGDARVPRGTDKGTYNVDVKCEGTNDTGRAKLRVAAEPSVVPTKAPRAGGGGTAAAAEDTGVPMGVTGLALVLALAGGIGVAVVRRRRS